MSNEDRKYETHPSFGRVCFSRVTGNPGQLFGSALDNHHNYITLSISRCEVEHHLNRDWYYDRDELIEVALSAAQFAELLTTMNSSPGTPCTITHLNGKTVERVPQRDVEVKKVKDGFEKEMKGLAASLKTKRAKVADLLDKKTLNKADKEAIMNFCDKIIMETESNIPFALDSFAEASEKVTAQAKAEVEAFMTTAIHRAGLDALQGKLPTNNELEADYRARLLEESNRADEAEGSDKESITMYRNARDRADKLLERSNKLSEELEKLKKERDMWKRRAEQHGCNTEEGDIDCA